MIKLLRILAALALIGVVVVLLLIFLPHHLTEPQEDLAADWTPEEGQGEYAMILGDCAGCHIGADGTPFAGGQPIDSPLGPIYASNITPDPEHGIGEFSLDDFRAVMYDGVDEEGHDLYPAMPYANYRKLSERDIRGLYHYFMEEVEPSSNEVTETSLMFPFNMRFGIRMWKWVALSDPGFEPPFGDEVENAEMLNRGAYLVEGPGHCGACHTPRNLIFAQKGFTAEDSEFLTGGVIDGWTAPDLRQEGTQPQDWDQVEMARFLATGRNAHAGVSGEMELVVQYSTQYWTENDLLATAAYLDEIGHDVARESDAEDDVPSLSEEETVTLLGDADPEMALGPRLYLDNCNACHFSDGRGAANVFPQLAGNATVTAPVPRGLVQTILEGAELPSTEAYPYKLRMPGFGWRLSDEEVAELATFVRNAWGNDAGAVTAADVAGIRSAIEDSPEGHGEAAD
ncbi:cytochrome c [Pseudoroseicyclus aestuarii]|uniref:Mono/diheme cytochrome c family protein n=1 Tax=Pseudoroseicyclus aestuarii TaxID=1795041 RepID=A0A318T0Y1_9RHOB|nr:c-type cytochrome [Pseudoroseicyclus aestuarii]PYE83844.1 mono/diheme cytochrome c family protein [Pseudoroseicyclus aestuarii]